MSAPVRTIDGILERRGLVQEDAHGPAPEQFERSEPNELWHWTQGEVSAAAGGVSSAVDSR